SKDNIRISPRIPGADIIHSSKKHLDEAYLVHGIIIIFLFVMGMERLDFRNVIINFVKSTLPVNSVTFLDLYWRNMWAIIIFILLTLGAAGLMYLSTRATFGKNAKQKFIGLSYAFVPLGLSVYLAENTFRLLKGLLYIAATIGNFFGRIWEFSPDFDTINRVQIFLLVSGFIFSLWAGYLISKRDSQDEKELQQSMIAFGFTAVVYLIIGVNILTLPII
ncbi:MAG: hypothetical protein QSU88_09735, partial [Candidatus Methanoperedens sp.]|nr:hypothetical protein [Candidatus Methanoperedens sp.]